MAEPSQQTLVGSVTLWLDDPACAWRVDRGRVQVFAAAWVDGRPAGRRQPLFVADAGAMLMAAPRGAALGLVATGLELDTAVSPVAPKGGPAAQRWLSALVRALTVPREERDGYWSAEAPSMTRKHLWTRSRPSRSRSLSKLDRQLAEADAELGRALERRAEREHHLRDAAYTGLGTLLSGGRARELADVEGEDQLLAAIKLVVGQLGAQIVESPASGESDRERIRTIAHASGIRACDARLTRTWWREDCGPLLGRMRDNGRPVALLQRRPGRYELVDPAAGTRVPIEANVALTLDPEAIAFYRPLPDGPLTGHDVLRYVLGGAIRGDLTRLGLYGILAGLLSLATPLATDLVFTTIVPQQQRGDLVWITVLLVTLAFAGVTFVIVQQLSLLRLEGRVTSGLQAALWDRLLRMRTGFFRRFSPGDLTMRVMGIDEIGRAATTAVGVSLVAIPIGVANLVLAFVLSPQLAAFASIAIVATVVGVYLMVRYQTVREHRLQHAQRELFQRALELVDAIGKLRVANATGRAFLRWAAQFRIVKGTFVEAQLGFVRLTAALSAATAFATALMLLGAATIGPHGISSATFLAFNSAFLQALVAATGLSAVGTFMAVAVPFFDNAVPILKTEPEISAKGGESLTLTGDVEVSHVNMRYGPDEPLVLKDLSVHVASGEMVAVVGPSGSGKSSLMRVLLGFEAPEVGSVRFDGHDLANLDVSGLRRQIGAVMQSSGLLTGDIMMNIVGARDLTVEDAWEAARIAGIERYVRTLPMGMQTIVGEGASTFSGGQRQRLLIARAVAGRPRILIFDEATSALDNRTQAEVAEAIAGLRATRIVIAHRLSTVRRADRIVVIVDGEVVQVGGFEALMAEDGPFRALASRQLL